MIKILSAILVLGGAVAFANYLIETGPEAQKRPIVKKLPVVEVQTLKAAPYTVMIDAAGVVKAGTQSNLVAEVSGRIVSIADNFKEGSYFDKGDVLLQIDKANYTSAIEIAKSEVAVNQANLIQLNAEQKSNQNAIALAKQNLSIGNKELTRIRALSKGNSVSRATVDAEERRINQLKQTLQNLQGTQNTFASRKNAIQARITASKAKLKQEELRLSRATIKAPYAGRVLKKNVDYGQFVPVGLALAEIYATDFVTVELPLSLNEYELLAMPEAFRNKQIAPEQFPNVTFRNPDSIRKESWQGKIVRTSAALDAQSRQINVIARIDKPYDARQGISSPLRIGQYLKANIRGKTFDKVYALPPNAVIYNREIRLLEDGKLSIVPVKVLWNASDATVIETTQAIEGKSLVLTNLAQAVNGMQAITVEQQRLKNKQQSSRKKPKAD